MIHLITKKS